MGVEEYKVKFSYMYPILVMIVGLVMLLFQGLKPYKDSYRKTKWIRMTATFQKAQLFTEDGPKSIVSNNTGSRIKIKLVLEYSPKSLFGSLTYNAKFPRWLKLPNKEFLWAVVPGNYDGFVEAKKAKFEFKKQEKYTIYINPANPREAQHFFWDKWLIIQIGGIFLFLGVFLLGLVVVLNQRAYKKAIDRAVMEAERLKRSAGRKQRHDLNKRQ
jgi:hypothetical protein